MPCTSSRRSLNIAAALTGLLEGQEAVCQSPYLHGKTCLLRTSDCCNRLSIRSRLRCTIARCSTRDSSPQPALTPVARQNLNQNGCRSPCARSFDPRHSLRSAEQQRRWMLSQLRWHTLSPGLKWDEGSASSTVPARSPPSICAGVSSHRHICSVAQ